MSKSYEERMAEKYNFLKKDNYKAPEISEKNLQNNPDTSENEANNEEAEAEFLREKLKNTREQLNQVKNKKRFFFF